MVKCSGHASAAAGGRRVHASSVWKLFIGQRAYNMLTQQGTLQMAAGYRHIQVIATPGQGTKLNL